jgi:hypothetical protein
MRQGWAAAAFLILLLSSVAASAAAPDSASDPAPAVTPAAEDLSGSIRLTPDTTKILRLEQDAVSVIVANPDHASVVLDSPRLLVVMPRQPGTTLFTVLNNKGETILEKNVIVAGTVKPQYVRIRRACGATDAGCSANSYYYCPDGCYEVTPVGEQGSVQAPPVVGGTGGAGGNGAEEENINVPSLPQGGGQAAPSEKGGGPVIKRDPTTMPGVGIQ